MQGEFSKVFEGYAWEALARGVPVAEVAEEAVESAWGTMASGAAAETTESPSPEPLKVPVSPVVAKAEAQAWIAAYRERKVSSEAIAPVAEEEPAPATNGAAANGAASNGNGAAAAASGAEEARAWIAAYRSRSAKSATIEDAGVWPPPQEAEPSTV